MLIILNNNKTKKGKSLVKKNHIMFIFERPIGRLREKPNISEKKSLGACIKKGNNIINPAAANPMLNFNDFFHSLLIAKYA